MSVFPVAVPRLVLQTAERHRARRVMLLLGLLVILGLNDLYQTITHATSIGMLEMNPIGAYLIAAGSIGGLILFKLGSMGITIGLLLKTRHRVVGEIGCWVVIAVMTALTVHWHNYNEDVIAELNSGSYQQVAEQMRVSLASH